MAAKTPTKRKGNLYDLTDDDLRGKGVFVRVDFDGPLIENQAKITDFSRFEATSPTIQYLIAHGARVILLWKSRSWSVLYLNYLSSQIPKFVWPPILSEKMLIKWLLQSQMEVYYCWRM